MQFGWRSTFVFMALFAILVLLVVIFKLPETRPKNTNHHGALYRWARYQPVLNNANFVFYAVVCMISMASIVAYVSYAPSWVIKHLGLSELTFSYLFGLNALINIAACFVAPKVIKKMGNRKTILLALCLMVSSALLQLLVQQLFVSNALLAGLYFMLPMLALCIGFALILGPATSMALDAFAERAGTASAILGCIQMAGAAVLVGILQQTGFSAPYATALMIGGGSLILLIVMYLPRCKHWH